ncbi:MAG: 4Fe-4S binding protein, partial [Alphaproteobacteria bacterium]|nr:4Fe-4S binding protein [Alphaproteobacteria bacterium]
VFLSVLFSGRSWCGLMCPMGAASEWANRLGPQRVIPRWVRWEGTPIVSIILVTIFGQTLGVRDHPEAIALVFGGTLLAAIALGFLYGRRKRAWCRHMCPIGLLLGVFSRLGAVQFAPKAPRPGGDGYTELGACPTMIDIPRKTESRHCIECFRCVSPPARGGLYLRLRRPGAEVEAIRAHNPRLAEVWFLLLGTGAALGGFLWLVLPLYERLRQSIGEWFIVRGWSFIGEAGPWWLMSVHPERREVFNWLDFMMIVGFMSACMVAVAAALALTTAVAAWLSGRFGGDRDFRARFVELGYQYAPVAMVSLLLGLGGALFEPVAALAGAHAAGLLKGAILIAGLVWSAHIGRRILARQGLAGGGAFAALVPGLLGSALVGLAWWPAVVGL